MKPYDIERTGTIKAHHCRMALRQLGLKISAKIELKLQNCQKDSWNGESRVDYAKVAKMLYRNP